jgi:hypothetical protein
MNRLTEIHKRFIRRTQNRHNPIGVVPNRLQFNEIPQTFAGETNYQNHVEAYTQAYRNAVLLREGQNNFQEGGAVLTRRQAALNTENSIQTPESENENLPEIETDEPAVEPMDLTEQTETEVQQERNENDLLFDKETLVAENNDVEVYVVKQYLKRQKIFQ